MKAAIEQFRGNIARVRNLGSLASILDSQTTEALDVSDILRAELAMAVSALDLYAHEVVRLGMLDAYTGNRIRTPAFLKFQVSLDSAMQRASDPKSIIWLDDQVRERHSRQRFQTPDNIAEAVRLISNAPLWNEVAGTIGMDRQSVTENLRLIVARRNQIVHEADADPSYPGALWPIDRQMTDEAVGFMEQVVEAIHSVVAQDAE